MPTTYDQLPLISAVLATAVCAEPYTGAELSDPSAANVAAVEALRQRMTPAQVHEFAALADAGCRAAFDAKAEWFIYCVTARGNRGRDQLGVWISHWLAAYLSDPAGFRRSQLLR
jgi:hypothetical protein